MEAKFSYHEDLTTYRRKINLELIYTLHNSIRLLRFLGLCRMKLTLYRLTFQSMCCDYEIVCGVEIVPLLFVFAKLKGPTAHTHE